MSFVKAMDALRGMFFMYQEGEKMWVANVKVRFHGTVLLRSYNFKLNKHHIVRSAG
jgi:hypothetical protein